MTKRLINACAVLLLLLMQLQGLWGSTQTVNAADNAVTIVDDESARVTVTPTVVDDRIDWQIDFDRHDPADHTTRAIRIRVAQAENGTGTVVRRDGDLEQSKTDADDEWYYEDEYSKDAQGKLVVSTDLDATQLVVWVQLDGQDMGGTVTKDLLQETAADPHTVTLPVAVQNQVAEAKETAAAKESPDVTTTTDVSAPELTETDGDAAVVPADEDADAEESVTADADAKEPETDTMDADTNEATAKVDPPGNAVLEATNLRLLANASADLKVDVASQTNNYDVKVKSSTATSGGYGSQTAMETNRYREYATAGSTAVIFRNRTGAGNVNLTLEYDYVGTVMDSHGQIVDIGAYVKIDNITNHNGDWNSNRVYAFDFSHNFYSGLVLANVRSFDWEVTFFVKGDKNTRVEFGSYGDLLNQAQLTFTSLNPGEFVNPLSGGTAEPEFDSHHVSHRQFYANTRVGVTKGNFENEYQNTSTGAKETMGYTSHTWGEWTPASYTNPDKEWEDWSGAATFAKGAVALSITGSTFKFKRGTYGASTNAWLALSSGSRELEIPKDLENRKSVSSQKLPGGGSPSDVATETGNTWTNNNLDQELVNSYHPNGTFYYYINQQTYSLNDYLAKPGKITITDVLPEHLQLVSGNDRARLFSDLTNGVAPSGDGVNVTNSVSTGSEGNRQKVTIELTETQIRGIAFTGGYFTIRLAVRVVTNPTSVDPRATLENKATVTMTPVLGNQTYTKETNTVTVYLGDKVNGTIQFDKVDADGGSLQGAGFTLYKNGSQVGNEVLADADGHVTFKDIAPGAYTMRETTTPDGFKPNSTVYGVTVNNDGAIKWTTGMPENNKVVNRLKDFELTVHKLNGADKQALSGAVFILTDANGHRIEEQTSNTDGKLIFSTKLVQGTYFIEETKAPDGFELLSRRIKVVVSATGISATYVDKDGDEIGSEEVDLDYKLNVQANPNTATVTVKNEPVTPPGGKLPDTGSRGLMGYMIGGLLLVLIGSAWALIQRRRGGDGHD